MSFYAKGHNKHNVNQTLTKIWGTNDKCKNADYSYSITKLV